MYFSDEAVERVYGSKWVEGKPNGELGYVLKPGAPKEIRKEFEEMEGLREAWENGTLEIISEDGEQAEQTEFD